MKSKSELNMEIEKLEDEIQLLKEGNYDLLYTNVFLQEDKTDLENHIVEAKKKADYYEAHYNVNYEIWLKQTKQIVDANKIIDEIQSGWEMAMEFERDASMRKIQLSAIKDCKRLRDILFISQEGNTQK